MDYQEMIDELNLVVVVLHNALSDTADKEQSIKDVIKHVINVREEIRSKKNSN